MAGLVERSAKALSRARCWTGPVFGEVTQDVLWLIVRRHEPVRADGVTPFSRAVTFDSLEDWAVDARAH